jgi:hypothetical protein
MALREHSETRAHALGDAVLGAAAGVAFIERLVERREPGVVLELLALLAKIANATGPIDLPGSRRRTRRFTAEGWIDRT